VTQDYESHPLKCFFGCKVKWDETVTEVPMLGKKYLNGAKIDEYKYVQEAQYGKCQKCGKIFRRDV